MSLSPKLLQEKKNLKKVKNKVTKIIKREIYKVVYLQDLAFHKLKRILSWMWWLTHEEDSEFEASMIK